MKITSVVYLLCTLFLVCRNQSIGAARLPLPRTGIIESAINKEDNPLTQFCDFGRPDTFNIFRGRGISQMY